MPTETGNIYIPGLNPSNFPDTKWGRFGRTAAGFGTNRGLLGLHHEGMGAANKFFGVYPTLGLGPGGLLDFSSYGAGGKQTLSSLSGTIKGGFMAEGRAYAGTAARIMRGQVPGASRMALGGSLAARSVAPAFFAYGMYQGYREGGVGGAIKGGAESLAWQYAISAGIKAASAIATPLAIGAAIAGVGFGSYKLLQAGNARMKRTRRLEMGSPMIDPFGNAATMRQRSLQALMGSQINGRSAFGSEGQLMHVPTLR
jgi:hypothetical protein